MFDVITFGSGTMDVYVKSKKLALAGSDIRLRLGSKIEAEDILFYSGGGGTNAAATFANQGLKVAYCGQVGEDYFGDLIIRDLEVRKINNSFVLRTKEKATNASVFLNYPGKDRAILIYRGASDLLRKKDIPWAKLKSAKWFYLAPFSGKLAELTSRIIDFAKKNKIKIAFNPGYDQLNFPKSVLKEILSRVDILILNREEASNLAGIPYNKEREIFRKIDEMANGIVIMTKGGKGATVSDGKKLFFAKSLAESLGWKIVDVTGAGDAFGSGFISGFLKSKGNIEHSMQLAMANSAFNLLKWGAKEGLLKQGQKWPKIKVYAK